MQDVVNNQINHNEELEQELEESKDAAQLDVVASSMRVKEETKWANAQVPNFDDSQPNSCTKKPAHLRETESLDAPQANASIMSSDASQRDGPGAAAETCPISPVGPAQHEVPDSGQESGVEQYESSDELQADPSKSSCLNTVIQHKSGLPYSSIQLPNQSSMTKLGGSLERSSPVQIEPPSEPTDSMAFNTIQPVHMDASLHEDFAVHHDEALRSATGRRPLGVDSSECQRENWASVTQNELPDTVGDRSLGGGEPSDSAAAEQVALRAPHSLIDQGTVDSAGRLFATEDPRAREGRRWKGDELPESDSVIIAGRDRGEAPSVRIFGQDSLLLETKEDFSPDKIDKKDYNTSIRQASFDMNLQNADIVASQTSEDQLLGARKGKKAKHKRRKRRSVERQGDSPASIRVIKPSSKSPAREKPKLVIQQGRIVATAAAATRESSFERHQFPIRKAKYDDVAVQKILLQSKGQFRSSARMMKKMQSRLS